jgi:predicted lipoprotein
MLRRLALSALMALSPTLLLAAPPEPGPLATAVIENWLLPRYEALASATEAQARGWGAACADGDFSADLEPLRQRFQTAADAWSAVEHVTTGPVSLALRADRIFFFPDRRNAVAKALGDLEAKARSGDIPAESFRGGSVAGQGFPALERLLYEAPDGEAGARCRVGDAIARNLARLSADILQEWRVATGPLARLKRGEGDPVHFADASQAAARLMTDLAGGVQRAVDLKLLPALGASADDARPKAAEGWRSGRSTRSLKIALASLSAQAAAFRSAAPESVAAADAKAFSAAEAAVAKLPDDLGAAVADPKRRRTVEATVAALKAAQTDLVKSLAPALGIPLGFNALDGD